MSAIVLPTGVPAIRRYKSGDRLPVQAQRIWLILSGYVSGRNDLPRQNACTITYGELALRMGYADTRAGHMLSRQLGIVGHYCLMNDLPALNAIVVNATTKEPGGDVVLTPGRVFREELRAIYRQDWYEVGVPSTGTLRKVWEGM
ncbi:hypothetical protein [Sphingopyxis macrogoltabida]|nr:hypothetical protein [Sphingopyxis macrogoltabida]ALJ12381.1 hypothetical protein LH19_05830 [Sphingopyxis macrogoltabida]